MRRALAGAGVGAGVPLLLACSGGPDSSVLVGLVAALAPRDRPRLAIGHVDHGLRPDSGADAAAVVALARRLGLPCGVRSLSLPPGPGLPARAREARRAALLDLAREAGAAFVALAHTATDQAETLLMHATRGCGLEGLAAIRPSEGPWLRPLLGLTRDDTRALCQRLGLELRDDPANTDLRHPRVRVRLEVLPRLRADNPRVDLAFAALASQAADAEEALAAWAEREALARRRGPSAWSVDDLHALPRAIRTRVLRRICAHAGVDLTALGAAVIDDIDRVLLARAAARGGSDAVLRPHAWDLRGGTLRLGRSGLRVGS